MEDDRSTRAPWQRLLEPLRQGSAAIRVERRHVRRRGTRPSEAGLPIVIEASKLGRDRDRMNGSAGSHPTTEAGSATLQTAFASDPVPHPTSSQ